MKVPVVRRDARPRRYFNGRWYAFDDQGRWSCEHGSAQISLLHRAVWAFHHGPITRSVGIEFKDGDKSNCDISNLRCVKKVPPNVWTLWRLGLRPRPNDRTFKSRVAAARKFWAAMTAGEREMYCILRALARREAQQNRRQTRTMFQMIAAGGAIHDHAR